MTTSKINIGLFGFGVVGESLWKVLQGNSSLQASIKKVCIKHPEKKRYAHDALFTTDAAVLLIDPEINVIVELIDDADAAYNIVKQALLSRRSVVTANKKMVAEHMSEFLSIQQQTGASLLYEAACCASIPVIRNLEEYYDNDLLQSVSGIVNGSTNYILTRIAEDGLDFAASLKQAQTLGFAESDPALDIEGIDAANKLSILLTHAYGIVVAPAEILTGGITALQPEDIKYAKEKGYQIKLVAHAKKLANGTVAALVLPQFLNAENRLYHVRNEYNGVIIESALADQQFFNGKGAGGFPTASAVISDLSALRYNYHYEYKKWRGEQPLRLAEDFLLKVYFSSAFDDEGLPFPHFEDIEEWSCSGERTVLVGNVRYSSLLNDTWWKKAGASLILLPEALEQLSAPRVPANRRKWSLVLGY